MAEIKIEDNPVKNPSHIPFSGWKSIVLRVKDQLGEHQISIVAAGVSYYSFLAIFPAIIALISIYGLVFNPQQVEDQLVQLAGMMPEEALAILQKQIENFLSTSGQAMSWGFIIGILFSIWIANKGIKSLFTGINIAYGIPKGRGLIRQNALTLLFTLAGIILVILCMSLIVGFPAFIDYIGIPENIKFLIGWLRWVVLAIIFIFFFSQIFRFAPNRPAPQFKWVITGAFISTFLWLVASWGFSFYVSNFGSYGEVYGSISAVVILMLWLYLSSFIILLGAEINSEMEYYARGKSMNRP